MSNVSLPRKRERERKREEERPADSSSSEASTGARPSELWFLAVFTIALGFITSLPYLIGYIRAFPGTVFTGTLDHSLDTNNYLAYVRQSSAGSWLFHNPMTLEPHAAVFFNLEWLVIGKVGFLLHLAPAQAMGVCRLLWLVLICAGVYWLSSFLFESVLMRRVALAACLTGGGFGWLATLRLLRIPIDSSYFLDLTNPNLFPFYWMLRVPHFVAAESFAILGLCFFLSAETSGKVRCYFGAGLCYVAAGLCRPYDMLFLMTATALFVTAMAFVSQRPLSLLALRTVPILMCLPILGYYYWIFKIHPVFRWWSLPGSAAPAAWLLAFGFGVSFLLLLVSGWKLRRHRLTPPQIFMLCCVVGAIALMYTHRWLHFSFQFATNIAVPMILLGLAGLEQPITKWKMNSRWAIPAIAALLFVNSFTSIALTGQAVMLVMNGEYRTDTQLLAAYTWLDGHSRSSDAVLADLKTSNQMPQYVHNSVFCGYGNAVRVDDKLKLMNEFFSTDTSNDFRENLLRQNGIQFVVLSEPESAELGALVRAPFVSEVFRNNAAVILAVRGQNNGS
jgi:hypothetical protein